MAHPFYEGLRVAYPSSVVHFLSPEILRNFPDEKFCQKKIIFSQKSKRPNAAFFKLAKQIKAESYDLAISLPASFSSSFLLLASGIKNRVGFSLGGSGIFLSDSIRWKGIKSGKHKSELYQDLLQFLSAKPAMPTPSEARPSLSCNRILVAPGASIPLRVWPYFSELLKFLSRQYENYEIAVVGASGEQHWHDTLKNLNLKNVRDYIEKTSLHELIDLCRSSALVIANDSGVSHIAGTLAQAPTLVLFGPGSPDYIKPLGPAVRCIVPEETPCHPCEKPVCHEKYGYQACLKAIPLQKVVTYLDPLLTGKTDTASQLS